MDESIVHGTKRLQSRGVRRLIVVWSVRPAAATPPRLRWNSELLVRPSKVGSGLVGRALSGVNPRQGQASERVVQIACLENSGRQ